MNTIKAVVVGDGAVGKTCLLVSYTTNRFAGEYVPTVFDNYSTNLTVQVPSKDGKSSENKIVHIDLWDTAGQEDYDRFRPLSYAQTDVFMVCFSIISPASLENVKSKWIPEIRAYYQQNNLPCVPLVLVGLKSDLRTNTEFANMIEQRNLSFIPASEGEKVAKEMGCVGYFECSSLTMDNVKVVFDNTVISVLKYRGGGKKERKSGGNGKCSRWWSCFASAAH